MYTVKQKTVFTKSIKDGSIQTCYLMHIIVDTVAEIPNAKENWLAGSRCDVLEDSGHVYMLSNGREWVEVNFFDRVSEGGNTDLSNYYTKSQTDERINESIDLSEYAKMSDIPIRIAKYTDRYKGVTICPPPNGPVSATGELSFAVGYWASAPGDYAYSLGRECTAEGKCSFASGYNSLAIGNNSHATGLHTQARGNNSFSAGYYTISSGTNQFAIGKFNAEDTDGKYSFIIGNGVDTGKGRSNAFSIDWSGNIYVNNSDTPVNVLDLLNRISALEDKIAELESSAST